MCHGVYFSLPIFVKTIYVEIHTNFSPTISIQVWVMIVQVRYMNINSHKFNTSLYFCNLDLELGFLALEVNMIGLFWATLCRLSTVAKNSRGTGQSMDGTAAFFALTSPLTYNNEAVVSFILLLI